MPARPETRQRDVDLAVELGPEKVREDGRERRRRGVDGSEPPLSLCNPPHVVVPFLPRGLVPPRFAIIPRKGWLLLRSPHCSR